MYRPTYQQSLDRESADTRSTYRPIFRPIHGRQYLPISGRGALLNTPDSNFPTLNDTISKNGSYTQCKKH